MSADGECAALDLPFSVAERATAVRVERVELL